ncbi:MAG: diguanylate cyclase [Candidatus Firestonebacteria bacterium]|nr:diguanylate cyclase [Candidatus Firestonebacteria bacterium]
MAEGKKEIILVVDDNPDDRRAFSRYLKRAGFEVEMASSVSEGVDAASKKEISCILVDYQMPGMSGIDMLKKVKADQKLKFIPVIMLTGLEQEEHILEGLSSGADDYLGKSSTSEIIIARIKAALRVKNMRDELKEANEAKTKALEQLDKMVIELRDSSIKDSLTMLYNHGYFFKILDNEFLRAIRHKQNICCLMIDIDFFKKVNDSYGHLFGDKVLVEIAKCLKKSIRDIDFLARYGGEEFVILLFNENYNGAFNVAQKLRKLIEGYVFEGESFSVKLTISIGISSLFEDGVLEKDKFLSLSDSALYAAKTKGRNSVVMYKDIVDSNYMENISQKELEVKILGINEVSKQYYIDMIKTLITTFEERDISTREHSLNVLRYSNMAAKEMRLSENEIQIICNAAILHDLGKIAISDAIILKDGGLTESEYEIIKKHPVIAVNILKSVHYIRRELDVILHHHEHYDGNGYPNKLKGKSIPLGSRIMAVADSYDAMRASRPYRKAMPMEEIINELVENSGTQFDPEIVYVFIKCLQKNGLIPSVIDINEKLEKIKK